MLLYRCTAEYPIPYMRHRFDCSKLQAKPSKIQGFGFQNEQNVTGTRKWLYAPNFRDMQPSMPMFAVVSHRKVVTEPVAMLSIVFYYPTNVALIHDHL